MGSVHSKISVIMSLLFKSRVSHKENTQSEGETDLDDSITKSGHTLIICSKTRIIEWKEYIKTNLSSGLLDVYVHYGRYRKMSLQRYIYYIKFYV